MDRLEAGKKKLETEAQEIYGGNAEHGIELSKAISLKRIADALTAQVNYNLPAGKRVRS